MYMYNDDGNGDCRSGNNLACGMASVSTGGKAVMRAGYTTPYLLARTVEYPVTRTKGRYLGGEANA